MVVTWQHRQHMDVLVRSPGHYHLQNRAYFLASNFRHCMIIVSINYSLSLSLSLCFIFFFVGMFPCVIHALVDEHLNAKQFLNWLKGI